MRVGAKPAAAPPPLARKPSKTSALMPRVGLGWALLLGLGGALPVIAAAVEGLREKATPTGDRAIILTRSFDVFSGHTPLVGQYSASSLLYDHVVHSLGPLLYWLLALPVRLGAATPALVAMAAVNALAIVASVALARRRGGAVLAVATAVALALMCGSLPPETLHDVWNPSAALLPFTLLLFVSWSLACGERRLLPVAVVLASFTAQAELVFLAPSAAALTIGVAGLLTGPAGRRSAWRWWLVALAVFVVCWSFPIVEELTGHPGNLTLVAEAAFSHGKTVGAKLGWHALVHAVGIVPWWLTSADRPFGRLADVEAAPSAFAAASCLVLLTGLACMLVAATWRRRRDLAWPAAIAILLCFSLAAMTASMSARPSLESSLGYMLWIGSPIGMFAWLTLIWGVLALVGPLFSRTTRRPRAPDAAPGRTWGRSSAAQALIAAGGLLAALGTGAAVAARQGSDQDRPEYRPVAAVQAAVRRALPKGHPTVLVTGSHSFTAFDFRAAVIYDLTRRGLRVYAPAASERLGDHYRPLAGRSYLTVWVFDRPRPPRRGRTIVRLTYGSRPPKTVTVMLSLARWPALTSRARAKTVAAGSGARSPS